MNIKIDPDCPVAVNIGVTSIAVVLNDLFKGYEQSSTLEDEASVSQGVLVMPLLKYKPRTLNFKGNGTKMACCTARLIVYSKESDTTRDCLRMIHPHRCHDKVKVLKEIPSNVREASFDEDGEITFSQLLDTLSCIDGDKINYHYNVYTGEGATMYRVGVVYEFTSTDHPCCIATAYFAIDVN